MLALNDTIAALATPPGEGGIGIVRVSGAGAFPIADRLFRPRRPHTPPPSTLPSHTLHYGTLHHPDTGETLDDALLLLFRAPHSYTGEDVVEFSCHGGSVTLGRVLARVLHEGARAAEPGEFTRRAFLNGRMDLAQAEAVCDQIRARTEAAQRLAVRQREGGLSRQVAGWKDALIGALAAVEVTIDFSEEVGDLDYGAMAARLAALREGITAVLATAAQGRIYREGARLVIVGRPNVGKSSLLNALLRENRAIVTPIAGTTRDTIEEQANIAGIPLVAVDTAGLRETADLVEQIGVERARSAVASASLLLFVLDAAAGWTPEDAQIREQIASLPALWVVNKVDTLPDETPGDALAPFAAQAGDALLLVVSAQNGTGMERLEQTIAETLLGGRTRESEEIVVSNVRHQNALESAVASLREAEATTQEGLPPDFISIDLRAALDALGQITGETATEEIIHRIFHDFCIGK